MGDFNVPGIIFLQLEITYRNIIEVSNECQQPSGSGIVAPLLLGPTAFVVPGTRFTDREIWRSIQLPKFHRAFTDQQATNHIQFWSDLNRRMHL